MKKYEFTGETKTWLGITLHRIKAVVSFGTVEAGELGGWIEKERNLSHENNAWVSGDAMVFGDAKVCGDARIGGNAEVYGNTWVSGHARICGDARVYGNAQIHDNARVFGNAQVYGNAWVFGYAKIYDDAQIYDNALVFGNAEVYGNAWVFSYARVCGDARVYGKKHIFLIAMIGSRDDIVTFCRSKERKIIVSVGCFRGGDIDEFEKEVKETHGDNEHAKAYMLAIELAKLRIDLAGSGAERRQDG